MATLHFEVVGTLWSGARAAYQYSDAKASNVPPGRVAARELRDRLIASHVNCPGAPRMGDFASVEDVRIIHELNNYESTGRGLSRRIDQFTTCAGWKDSSSGRFYARATFGRFH